MSVLIQEQNPCEDVYPIFDVGYYQKIPTLSQYTIHSIHSITKLLDSGSHHSIMYRVVLRVTRINYSPITDYNDSPQQPQQQQFISLIAKILKSTDQISQDARELYLYKDVVKDLTTDHLTYQNSPLKSHSSAIEPFYAPEYFYGEECPQSFGKLLLMGDICSNNQNENDNENGKTISCHSPSAAQCGWFYGYISPHNRNKDLAALTRSYPNLSPITITKHVFGAISLLHAKYWNNTKDNIPSYVPGKDIYCRIPNRDCNALEGVRSRYTSFIDHAKRNFSHHQQRHDNGVVFSQYLLDIISTSLERSTWENFYAENISDVTNASGDINNNNNVYNQTLSLPSHIAQFKRVKKPFTLIHGDFYPANVMITSTPIPNTPATGLLPIKAYIFDYELSCVSHLSQDLTQFIISHLDPQLRMIHEKEILQHYHYNLAHNFCMYNPLISLNEFTTMIYPFEQLFEDYIMGCGKWLWLVAMCCDWDFIPNVLLQHFIDQLTHFLQSHGVSVENVPILKPT